jgi:hypothetical protein
MSTRADRDLVFQDFEVVVGWGFGPSRAFGKHSNGSERSDDR